VRPGAANKTISLIPGPSGRPGAAGHTGETKNPADARHITIRAVRLGWETMLGRDPAPPPGLPDRLPADLIPFAAAKGCLGAVMKALDWWGAEDLLERSEREHVRRALARTALATAAMRRELGSIFSECRAGGIEIVLFKGHDLITTCYHDDTIRPVTDADLLVRRGDYGVLSRILSDAGYRQNTDEDTGTWFRGGLIIDVHREFVEDTRNPARAYLPHIPTDEIFSSSGRRQIDGADYRSPGPHHSLIMTALHALTHSYLMDFWFMDAGALFITNNDGSFPGMVMDTARRYRLDHVVNYHLWAIREVFGYPGDLPLPGDYRPPPFMRRLITAAVGRTDYLFFGDILLGLTIDSHKRKFYYFIGMVLPRRDIIASEMDVHHHNTLGIYLARLGHLIRAGFRVLFSGRR